MYIRLKSMGESEPGKFIEKKVILGETPHGVSEFFDTFDTPVQKLNQRFTDVPKNLIHSPLVSEVGLEIYETTTGMKNVAFEIHFTKEGSEPLKFSYRADQFTDGNFGSFLMDHKIATKLFADALLEENRQMLPVWMAEFEAFVRKSAGLEKN